jgi:hypothetical protein
MGTVSATFGSGSFLLGMLQFFLFLIWFYLLIVIFGDIFRDRETSGGAKALWVVFVVVLPYLGILVYLIARGKGMAARSAKQAEAAQQQFDARIRSTAGTTSTPADQITSAKALLDTGSITLTEFDQLKAKALA